MRPLDRGHLAGRGQPLRPVLPEGLEHPVARLDPGQLLQQRLVGQRGQQVGHVRRLHGAAGADHLGRLRADAAGEDRDPVGQRGLRVGEQVPAPGDHRPQRLVPGQRGPAAAGEQPEPVVEPGGHLGHRQRAHPGRGQLDGQRHAVEPAADLHHRTDRVARPPAKPGRTAAARSASSRTAGKASACSGAASGGGSPSGATGASASPVIASGSRLVARMRSCGQRASSSAGGAGGGLDQVLAVVQHDQRAPVGEQVDEQGQRVGLAGLLPAQRLGRPDARRGSPAGPARRR